MRLSISLLLCAGLLSAWVAGGADRASAASVAPCPPGKALFDSGRSVAAETAYAEALKVPETEPCAKAGLTEIDEKINECATAEALDELGRDEQAQAAYEKVLETKPESECAKKGIADTGDSFWEDPKGTAEDAVAWLALLVAAIAVAALVISVLLLFLAYIPVVKNRWPAKRIRAVRVSLESFDDVADPSRGGALAALVRTKIESFGEKKGMKMVDSKAALEETLLSELGEVNDQAKSFSAFISWIVARYPRRQYEAKGQLQENGGSGPGLTVSLGDSKGAINVATLWPQQFGLEADEKDDVAKAARLQKLCVPAAAWISHVTVTAAGETLGGAKDPISWAFFKTGLEWEQDEDTDKAFQLYKEAIRRDKTNWGAQAQLGKLQSEAREYDAAIQNLEAALETLEG